MKQPNNTSIANILGKHIIRIDKTICELTKKLIYLRNDSVEYISVKNEIDELVLQKNEMLIEINKLLGIKNSFK